MSERLRIALVAEELRAQPAEGVLCFLDRLLARAQARHEVLALHDRGELPEGMPGRRVDFSKWRTSPQLKAVLHAFTPNAILYAPSASATPNALWRARCLQRDLPSACHGFLALQERPQPAILRPLLRALRPQSMTVLSERIAAPWRALGYEVDVVPAGVDRRRFRPVPSERKRALRAALAFDADAIVALHVGHLRRGRGLSRLAQLAQRPGVHAVVVASPLTPVDASVLSELRRAGVEVRREYVGAIEEFYQASDVYVFPVEQSDSSIEFPLSVLEALACGLPVVTTRFGSLPEHFAPAPGLVYYQGAAEFEPAFTAARNVLRSQLDLSGFDWEAVADRILNALARRCAERGAACAS
jgi:glycosyltransferase involved in cell wall biosynthesis